MPAYTVTLNSGVSYNLDAENAAQAAMLANEGAAESGDTVRSVSVLGQTEPVSIAGRGFEATGFDPTLTGGPGGAEVSPFDELSPEEALDLFGEDVPVGERQDYRPTLLREGEQTRQLLGAEGSPDDPFLQRKVADAVDEYDDTGVFVLPPGLLDMFGLPAGAIYDREKHAFVDKDGNVIRQASGFDANMLQDFGVMPLAAVTGTAFTKAKEGALQPDVATTAFGGPYDTPRASPYATAAYGPHGAPETLEDFDARAAYFKGLQMGGYGDITGPRTGFQSYLEALQPLYESLYGFGNLASGYTPEGNLLQALGVEPADFDLTEQEQLERQAPRTFEEFIAGTGPRAAREQSLALFNQLAAGAGTPSEPGSFAQQFTGMLQNPNPNLQGGLQQLAQSALRSQLGSTGFNLIAGNLPNMQDLMSRQRAETGGTMPTNYLETLGGAYGLKKRKVGADGSVTEEFFGG